MKRHMAEHLTLSEISDKYPNQWVLLIEPVTNDDKQLLGGIVAFHGPDADHMYREAMKLPKPSRTASFYTGTLPEDVSVFL